MYLSIFGCGSRHERIKMVIRLRNLKVELEDFKLSIEDLEIMDSEYFIITR